MGLSSKWAMGCIVVTAVVFIGMLNSRLASDSAAWSKVAEDDDDGEEGDRKLPGLGQQHNEPPIYKPPPNQNRIINNGEDLPVEDLPLPPPPPVPPPIIGHIPVDDLPVPPLPANHLPEDMTTTTNNTLGVFYDLTMRGRDDGGDSSSLSWKSNRTLSRCVQLRTNWEKKYFQTRRYRTHLSTDKPIYRPLDTLFLRGVIVDALTNAPFPLCFTTASPGATEPQRDVPMRKKEMAGRPELRQHIKYVKAPKPHDARCGKNLQAKLKIKSPKGDVVFEQTMSVGNATIAGVRTVLKTHLLSTINYTRYGSLFIIYISIYLSPFIPYFTFHVHNIHDHRTGTFLKTQLAVNIQLKWRIPVCPTKAFTQMEWCRLRANLTFAHTNSRN